MVILLVGVLIFSGILPGFRAPTGGTGGQVVWWGTLPLDTIQPVISALNESHQDEFTLEYVEKNPRSLELEFIEALASGQGPDLILLPDDLLLKQADKLYPIPYETFSRGLFQDTFARGAELYLGPEGILGLPLYVDPLVMYYNRDLISGAALPKPPGTWGEVGLAVPLLRQTDAGGNILQSPIGLGEFSNLLQAKDLLALLMLQAGTPIIDRNEAGQPEVVLQNNFGFTKQPAAEAVAFFNRFADPSNTLYSWNTALPEARELFARGQLALYLGYASEFDILRRQNPLLDFEVALVPQRESGLKNLTLGRFPAVSIVKNSQNLATAFQVAYYLAGAEFVTPLIEAIKLPPARLDLLGAPPARDARQTNFFKAAVMATTWLDPDPAKTREIFKRLVDTTQVGTVEITKALNQAHLELEALLR